MFVLIKQLVKIRNPWNYKNKNMGEPDKGGKSPHNSLGKGGAKYHGMISGDSAQETTKPALGSLACRGGVKRIQIPGLI